MLIRVVIAAVLIFGVMVGIKDGRLTRQIGLAGSCQVVQTAADGTQVDACHGGRLAGRPDLSSKSCTSTGFSGAFEYWRCPAPVDSRPGS
jgi:hypothetical protein